MAATNTKGTQICVVKGGATGTTVTVTAATAAKPAGLTTTGNALVAGDVVEVKGSGNAKLDGVWILGAGTTATNLELVGSDNTGGATAFSGTGTVIGHPAGNMTCLCLSSFAINRDQPGTISTATFCTPTASVPSVVSSAGTVTIGGFVDVTADDFREILAADGDGVSRTFRVKLPGNNGYLVFGGVISGFSYDVPLDGALAWSATITLAAVPRHLY
jgi:hypothetical protein